MLIPLDPDGDRPPLYCVHSASGSAYSYLPLVQVLAADQPLYGLEAPGLEDPDDKPLTTVADLATRYLRAIAAERPGEPICLLGWSFGGVIAYEMAQRLERAGTPARQLIVIDTPALGRAPMPAQRAVLRRFLADLTGVAPFSEQPELDRALAGRPAGEPVEDTFAALIEQGVLPADLDDDTLTQRYQVFHANVTALYDYQPAGRYHGPMVAMSARESPEEAMDWSALAPGVTAVPLPGDHYTIWQGENLVVLAELISRSLDDVATC